MLEGVRTGPNAHGTKEVKLEARRLFSIVTLFITVAVINTSHDPKSRRAILREVVAGRGVVVRDVATGAGGGVSSRCPVISLICFSNSLRTVSHSRLSLLVDLVSSGRDQHR